MACANCGERRIAGVVCSNCGERPDPREIDPDKRVRQRQVERALAILDSPDPKPSAGSSAVLPTFWAKAEDSIESLLEALFIGGRVLPDEERLSTALGDFLQLRSDARSSPRLRPWLDLWHTVDQLLETQERATRTFLGAVAGETPLEAQRLAASAQAQLDEMAATVAALNARLERWRRIEKADTLETAIAVSLETSFEASGASTLLEFDKSGEDVYRRVTCSTDCPVGLGFGLNLMVANLQATFDESRFFDVARAAFQIVTADAVWLSRLIADGQWNDDMKDNLTRAWDAAPLHEAALSAVRHDRQAARALLNMAQQLAETSGRRLSATLISAVKGRPYADYADQTSGNLLKAARQIPSISGLLDGVDPLLRIASAHEEFEVLGDDVVLRDRGQEMERLSLPALTDRVIQGIESTSAVAMAALCAAAATGADPFMFLPSPTDLGIGWDVAALWILGGSGWQSVEAETSGDALRVAGLFNDSPKIQHVATLMPWLEGCGSVVLVARSDDGSTQTLEVPTPSLRESLESSDELTRQIRFLETCAQSRLNGQESATRDQIRKVFATMAGAALKEQNVKRRVATIRSLMQSARRLGDSELDRSLGSLLSALRGGALGLGASSSSADLKLLERWARQRLPQLRCE